MKTVRLSLPTVAILVAVVGAGAFAAGQSMSSDSVLPIAVASAPSAATPEDPEHAVEDDDLLPPGHPPTASAGTEGPLPAGHPPVRPTDQARAQMPMAAADPAGGPQSPLQWQLPARWQVVPNTSPFRIATCRVPRAPGDDADAELSITQAGGSVEANAARWIAQFDEAGQKTAKRITRRVGALDVTIVEVQGAYSGGMTKEAPGGAGWALLGAIAATPGSPHFFKLTGPAKTVLAARREFDQMISSLVQR